MGHFYDFCCVIFAKIAIFVIFACICGIHGIREYHWYSWRDIRGRDHPLFATRGCLAYEVKIRGVEIFALFVYSSRNRGWSRPQISRHEYQWYLRIPQIQRILANTCEYRNFHENDTTKIVKMPHNMLSQQNIGAPICLAYA